MKFKKILLLIFLIFICFISISAISADDNLTVNIDNNQDFNSYDSSDMSEISSHDEISELDSSTTNNFEDNVLKSDEEYDVYFNASNPNSGDGTKDNPYQKFNVDISGKKAYFANGEYDLTYINRDISGSVYLTGESTTNVIINCNRYYFAVSRTGSLFLNNLTIKNHGVLVYNKFNAEGVDFIHCQKSINYDDSTFGGAITAYPYPSYYSSTHPEVILNNCNFHNSTATYGGSVYMENGTLNIKGCKFLSSSSYSYGAGIALLNSISTIYDSLFINGKSSNDLGGAVYAFNTNLSVNNSDFINCNSTFGTITILDGSLNLYNSLFENNTVKFEGGAIFNMYSPMEIKNSTFIRNSAINGGALFVDNSTTLKVYDSTFQLNNASNIGGAIFSNGNLIFIDSNNTFANNLAYNFNNIYNQSFWPIYYGGSNSTPIVNRNLNVNGSFPSKYDLRDLNQVTSVKNQGEGGNCWAFATLAALESAILKANNQTYDFSEENMKNLAVLFSEYGMFANGLEKMLPNDGGFFDMSVGYLVSWMGPILEEMDTYDGLSFVSYLYPNSTVTHIQNVYYVPPRESYTDNDGIKEALMKYGALAVSMMYNYNYLYGYSYYSSRTSSVNHAVTIVGWDDDYSASNFGSRPPGNGAFIVKNSWDTDWGNQGYFYVSYYDVNFCKVGTQDAICFILNDSARYNKNYQYDMGAMTDWLVTGENNIWYKNIFNSTGDDYLTAFSTYFNSTITDFTAYVYVNDKLVDTVSGSKPMGYYTIHLNKLVPLKKGDTFEIVININSTELASFPVEEAANYRLHSVPGISYFSYDGLSWTDLHDYKVNMSQYGHYYNGNMVASIKAFTVNPNALHNVTIKSDEFNSLTIKNTTITAYLTDNTDGSLVNEGYVDFEIDGRNYTVKVNEGIAELNYSFIKDGKYPINLYYNGGANYNTENITINANISKISTYIVIKNQGNSKVGLNKINITVFDEEGNLVKRGTIKLLINNKEQSLNLVNGTAIYDLNINEESNITINVYYTDNDSYINSDNTAKLEILKYNINAGMDSLNKTLIINLTDDFNLPIDDSNIILNIYDGNMALLNSSNLNSLNGTASYTYDFNSGKYFINLVYSGDNKYNSLNKTVSLEFKPLTNMEFTVNNKYLNESEDLIVRIFDWNNNPVNTGKVNYNIYLNNQRIHNVSVDIVSGIGNYTYKFDKVGNYTIYVYYIGEGYINSENYSNMEVFKIKTKIYLNFTNIKYGEIFYMNVKLNSTLPTGYVTLFIDNLEYGVNLNNGSALISVPDLNPGTYNAKITYEGDDNFDASSCITLIRVKKLKLNTAIVSNDFNQMAVDFYNDERGGYFKVILKDIDNNTLSNKTIKIGFNGVVYTRSTDENGSAILQINLKFAGTYTFATAFLSDDDYEGSFTVNKITISKKPSKLTLLNNTSIKANKTKTLTFVLQGQNATNSRKYIDAKNKTLTVSLNGKTYNLKTDQNGKASLNIKISKAGTYIITTKFAGDGTYNHETVQSKITVTK